MRIEIWCEELTLGRFEREVRSYIQRLGNVDGQKRRHNGKVDHDDNVPCLLEVSLVSNRTMHDADHCRWMAIPKTGTKRELC